MLHIKILILDLFVTDTGDSLQGVDVLGEMPEQQTLLLQQLDKVMTCGRLEGTRIEFFCQSEEWLGILLEVADIKDSCRVGQVIFLQIVVQPSSRGSEVRDPSRG